MAILQPYLVVYYMFVFHKTEIKTVILRCLTSPNHNWNKSYDKKHKNAKNTIVYICTKSQKKRKWKYLPFVL